MKATALLFALVMLGGVQAASAQARAQAKTTCNMPLYIEAADGAAHSTMDSTGSLFLYGLKTAVTEHQGCIVDKMADAHLGLFITTLKLPNDAGAGDSSVIDVALAVPVNGILVYMDHYLLVVRDSDNVEGQVDALLESIGETLDRSSSAQ